jgi:hypothetical protein
MREDTEIIGSTVVSLELAVHPMQRSLGAICVTITSVHRFDSNVGSYTGSSTDQASFAMLSYDTARVRE